MAVHSKLTKFVKSHDGLLPLYFNPETGAPPGTASTRTPPVTLGGAGWGGMSVGGWVVGRVSVGL